MTHPKPNEGIQGQMTNIVELLLFLIFAQMYLIRDLFVKSTVNFFLSFPPHFSPALDPLCVWSTLDLLLVEVIKA